MCYCGESGAWQWNRVKGMSKESRVERRVAARPQAPHPIREASPRCVRGSPSLILPVRSAGVKPRADREGGDVLYVSESHKVPKKFQQFASRLLL
jgi:hypothetical protein